MGSEKDFKSLQDSITANLVNTTRTAGQIASEDLAFHRSSDPSVTPLLNKENARLLALARSLLTSATSGTEITAPGLPDADAVDDNWQGIVDVVDNLLEKTDSCLDEYTGVIKRLSPSQRSTPTPVAARRTLNAQQYKKQDIPKPQLRFNKIPDNKEITAFKPLLRAKPHAIVPLKESTEPLLSEDGFKEYRHPYEAEITQSSYPPPTYIKSDPIPFLPFESTKATFVDTLEEVAAMLAELKTAKEVAVDLEHHDTHSYIGLVSLMQISTREKDWVVDTLQPWREELQVLNEVFADPDILKVFHGAFMDIIWLQRDLGLYVVGLFDTFHASNSLGYPQHSLAYLLSKFVNFDAQKKYQMADWRIRPLPEEMFNYARSDTHFLLYIYDNMRNELIDKSNASDDGNCLIDVVLEESKKVALKKYDRPIYDVQRGTGATGWYNMLLRTPALFTRQQFAVFRAVHQWRDDLARRYDESVNVIMQKNAIFNIAREMPVDLPALLGCSHPISASMRQHADELLGVIRRSKASGINGPELKDLLKEISASTEPTTGKVVTRKPQQTPQAVRSQLVPVFPIDQNAQSMRSEHSTFWGLTTNDRIWSSLYDPRFVPRQPEIRLALPLPQLTAEVFSSGNDRIQEDAETTLANPGSRGEHRYVKERKVAESEVFVIKDLVGNRKRKAMELQETTEEATVTNPGRTPATSNGNSSAMELSLNISSSELAATEKAERKAARKAQKKAQKARQKQDDAQSKSNAEKYWEDVEEPFDYNQAPSVLHAKPNRREQAGQKKAFDPYSKSLNAPKGMRKSKKEIAGRSSIQKG
ncbi:exosome nuclease subunit [Trapelia coarctata]|nr:exosome nuclease subunit [Trapelia coarctata]